MGVKDEQKEMRIDRGREAVPGMRKGEPAEGRGHRIDGHKRAGTSAGIQRSEAAEARGHPRVGAESVESLPGTADDEEGGGVLDRSGSGKSQPSRSQAQRMSRGGGGGT